MTKNRHLELSYQKIYVVPYSSMTCSMISSKKKFLENLQGWQTLWRSLLKLMKIKRVRKLDLHFCLSFFPKYLKYCRKIKFFSKNRCQGCHISRIPQWNQLICTSYWSTQDPWMSGIVETHWNQNYVSRELCLINWQLIQILINGNDKYQTELKLGNNFILNPSIKASIKEIDGVLKIEEI